MRILILSTARSGSTKLLNWLCQETGFKRIHEPFNKKTGDKIYGGNNIIVKEIVAHLDEDKIYKFCLEFDKIITLKRNNILESAISLLYCSENIETYDHVSIYEISDEWLEKRKELIENIKTSILHYNDIIDKVVNCLHVTYEKIYEDKTDIDLIHEYIEFKKDFRFTEMLNKKYRLRNGKRTII